MSENKSSTWISGSYKSFCEAQRKIARVAMGDLIGTSEPPEGMPDQYPFNAPAWLPTFPAEWRDSLRAIIGDVYENEAIPDYIPKTLERA